MRARQRWLSAGMLTLLLTTAPRGAEAQAIARRAAAAEVRAPRMSGSPLEDFLSAWLAAGAGGNERLDALGGERDVRTWYIAARLPEAPGEGAYVVYLTGDPWCGVNAGCTLLVVAQDGRERAGYRVIGQVPIVQLPIGALPGRDPGAARVRNGQMWPDLTVWASGGGLAHPRRARLSFDGVRYAGNPSTAPLAPRPGRLLLTESSPRRRLPAGPRPDGGSPN